MREIKDELGKRYGTYTVTACTDRRYFSNGCVIWECTCNQCGTKCYLVGNDLRFNKIKLCPVCNPKKNR